MKRHAALVPLTYEAIPLGSTMPLGWLEHEIKLSATGLGGHLFEFYRFVKDSTWLGGSHEYSPLNEAAPYWYNYIVPLAYNINQTSNPVLSRKMREQAATFLDYTIQHQAEDGWLGPEQIPQTRGIWARCLLLQGMIQHAQADLARRQAIIRAIIRFIRLIHKMLADNFRGLIPGDEDVFDSASFGVARAHELSLSLQWFYNIADEAEDKILIWEIMEMLWTAAELAGRDWTKFFTKENFPTTPSVKGQCLNLQHGVNVAEGLRFPAQKYRMHPSRTLRRQCRDALDMVLLYHGTPSGSFSSDEYLGGTSPQRGVELCCTTEFIFSLNYLYSLFGESRYAEKAEVAAFNAFPAAISDDWWSHQYVTQVNQPWATELPLQDGEGTPFYDVGRYANVFGLEPDYPCCTVNHPVTLPKLAMNTFLGVTTSEIVSSTNSILAAYFLPAELNIHACSIKCNTRYPFSDEVKYTIKCEDTFDFLIRVPSWALSSSTISTSVDWNQSSSTVQPFSPHHNMEKQFEQVFKITVPKSNHFVIDIDLDIGIYVHRFADGTISIYRGSLLFAYEIAYTARSIPPRDYKDQVSDRAETFKDTAQPKQEWMKHVCDNHLTPNGHWGIAINATAPMKFFRAEEKEIADFSLPNRSSWSSANIGMYIEVQAVEIDWPVANGTAVDPGTFEADDLVKGKVFTAKLVPYGCAKLHLAQFPVLQPN